MVTQAIAVVSICGGLERFRLFGHVLAAAAPAAISERLSGVNAAALASAPILLASDRLEYWRFLPMLSSLSVS